MRWGTYHQELATFIWIRLTVNEAMMRMIAEGGCDHNIVKDGDDDGAKEVIDKHTLNKEEWTLLQKYERALNRI